MYAYINWSSCLSHHLWGIGTQIKGAAHYETKLKIKNLSFLQTYALVYFNNAKKWSQ